MNRRIEQGYEHSDKRINGQDTDGVQRTVGRADGRMEERAKDSMIGEMRGSTTNIRTNGRVSQSLDPLEICHFSNKQTGCAFLIL